MDKDLKRLTDEVDNASVNLRYRTAIAAKRLRSVKPTIVVAGVEKPSTVTVQDTTDG
jgi:hypothetical protein